MSSVLTVLGWLGMVPVLAVVVSATAIGAGLPVLLVSGAAIRVATPGVGASESATPSSRASEPSAHRSAA